MFPNSNRNSRDPNRRVRFTLPDSPARQRHQGHYLGADAGSTFDHASLRRRVSEPLSGRPGSMGMTRTVRERSHALENLRGLRDYVKEACNFHGDDKRMALSFLSVDDLCDMIKYISTLRPDPATDAVMTRDFKRLRAIMDDPSRPFPHDQLIIEHECDSQHELNFRRASKGRDKRRCLHALNRFVSRQLHVPIDRLRSLPSIRRQILIRDAFRQRVEKFAKPHSSRSAQAASIAASVYGYTSNQYTTSPKPSEGTGSAPQSPAGRQKTVPHSSLTDPPRGLRRAYDAETGLPFDYEPLPDLSLPTTRYEPSQSTDRLKRRPTGPVKLAAHNDIGSTLNASSSTPHGFNSQTHGLHQSPHMAPTTHAHARTPPQPVAHSPYTDHPAGYGYNTHGGNYHYATPYTTDSSQLPNANYTATNLPPRTPPRTTAPTPAFNTHSGYQNNGYTKSPGQRPLSYPVSSSPYTKPIAPSHGYGPGMGADLPSHVGSTHGAVGSSSRYNGMGNTMDYNTPSNYVYGPHMTGSQPTNGRDNGYNSQHTKGRY